MNRSSLPRNILRYGMLLPIVAVLLAGLFVAPYPSAPILMYHKIGEHKDILYVREKLFHRQMAYLKKNNYNVVPLDTLVDKIKNGENIPRKWVVITFDDGHESLYTKAYPILKKHQFPAIVFLAFDAIGKGASLSWDQITEMQRSGLITFGYHSLSHVMLPLLTEEEATREIDKRPLEEKLGQKVDYFAYPSGAYSQAVIRLVRNSGYKGAVGTAYQRYEVSDKNVYLLKRVFVQETSIPFAFPFMISGYYVPVRELLLRVLGIKTPRSYYEKRRKQSLLIPGQEKKARFVGPARRNVHNPHPPGPISKQIYTVFE